MRIRILTAIAAVALGGCAITSMEAKIAPDVAVPEENIGIGRAVGVSVFDERPNSDVGRRAVAGAKIKMNDDIATIYQAALIDGLKRKGFAPVAGALEDGPTLKIEIRSLSYEVSTGWWTGGIETDSSVKAYAIGAAEPYERLYRASDDDRIAVVPGAKTSNAKLNRVVTATLRQLLEDRKMLELLATPADEAARVSAQ